MGRHEGEAVACLLDAAGSAELLCGMLRQDDSAP